MTFGRAQLGAVVCFSLGLLLAGCEDLRPAAPPTSQDRGTRTDQPNQVVLPSQTIAVRPRDPNDPFAGPQRGRLPATPTKVPHASPSAAPQPSAVPAPVASPSPEAPPPRDLSAELRAQLPALARCVQSTGQDLSPEVRVSVIAVVQASGVISRATVSSSALDPAGIACASQAAQGIRLAQPIDGAPRTVSASIAFQRSLVQPAR